MTGFVHFPIPTQDKQFIDEYISTKRLLPVELEKAHFLLQSERLTTVFLDGTSSSLLLSRFENFGHLAIFESGLTRKDDFKRKHGQGGWAEGLLLNADWPGFEIVLFGPSDGVIPEEAEYEKRRLLYRETTVLEGKRPDLLLFPNTLTSDERKQLAEWPSRPLRWKDRQLMSKCVCGFEVKSSLWHYGSRRASSRWPLSIPMKLEEVKDIEYWIARTKKPLVFVQAFVDELYLVTYAAMKSDVASGRIKAKLEPETGKDTYKFPITNSAPLLANVLIDGTSPFTITEKGKVSYVAFWPPATLDIQAVDVTSMLTKVSSDTA